MKKYRCLLALFLLLLIVPLYAHTLVQKTEHFDIIYEEESAAMAMVLAQHVEEDYQDLVQFFRRDPQLHLPVYITRANKDFNAYSTLYPYSRIVLFDTVPDYDIGLSNAENTIRFVFRHELTHSFTMNMRGKSIHFLSRIFGDPVSVTEFYEFLSFVEGIAVTFESKDGGGRLNTPLATTQVKQARIEGKEISYRDASGSYDIYPSGNIPYMFGGSFLEDVRKKYGEESLARLFSSYGELHFSTTASTFQKITGTKLKTAWNDFYYHVPVPTNIRSSVSLTDYGRYNKLDIQNDQVYGLNAYLGTVFSISSDNSIENMFSNGVGSYVFAVTPEGNFLIGDVTDSAENVRLLDEKGHLVHNFKGYRSGSAATLEGEEVYVLYGAESQTTYLSLFDKNFREIGRSTLGYGVLAGDFAFLEDGIVLFVLSSGGTEYLALLDLKTMDIRKAENTLGLEFSTLNADGNGTGTFGYVVKADPSALSRYGEVSRDGKQLVLRLSSVDFSGGVYYPVKRSDNRIYYISRYFDGPKLSSCSLEQLVLQDSSVENLVSWIPTAEPSGVEEFLASSFGYRPLSYMKRGFLLPFGASTSFSFAEKKVGLGASFFTCDPKEDHTVTLTAGVSEDLSPILGVEYLYRDLIAVHANLAKVDDELTPDVVDPVLRTEVDGQLKLSFRLGPKTGTLGFVETLGIIQKENQKVYGINDLTLSYSDVFRVDNGRFNKFGAAVSVSYSDYLDDDYLAGALTFAGKLYVPKILPLHSTPRDTFNLPLTLAGSVRLQRNNQPVYSWNGTVYLYSHEVQKATPFLWLFIRNVNLYGVAEGSLKGDVLSQQYSLRVSSLLTPVLGEIGSSLAAEVGGALSWSPEKGLSLAYILDVAL